MYKLVCKTLTRATVAMIVGLLLASGTTRAGEVKVAVAANFTEAAKEIGQLFEKTTGHRALFSFASTGILYTQISRQAPFEVFLAADQARPQNAVDEGFAVAGSRFTYATGRIVLYSRDKNRVSGENTLKADHFSKLAIANPVTAPYGAAAVTTMKKLGVYDAVKSRIVRGNNIAQTYQFVETGNAELGFVALSQVARRDTGSRWLVPDGMYPPIAQDAVLLKQGADNPAAVAFVDFLKGPEAAEVKAQYGYGTGN